MGGGSHRTQNPFLGIDQSTDLMPSFNPLDTNPMNALAMNSTQNIVPKNIAGKPWNLGNSGGSILGQPGSALGGSGSALGGAGSALSPKLATPFTAGNLSAGGMAGAGLTMGPANEAIQGASRFGLDLGAKSAGDLALKTGGSGLGFANFAGMIPQAALQLGIPQALFGRYAGNALAQGGSGALTGMAMGGPVGAGVGGGLGLLSGLLGGGGQRPRPNVPTMPFGDEYSY